jgi:hypothetical protein
MARRLRVRIMCSGLQYAAILELDWETKENNGNYRSGHPDSERWFKPGTSGIRCRNATFSETLSVINEKTLLSLGYSEHNFSSKHEAEIQTREALDTAALLHKPAHTEAQPEATAAFLWNYWALWRRGYSNCSHCGNLVFGFRVYKN